LQESALTDLCPMIPGDNSVKWIITKQ